MKQRLTIQSLMLSALLLISGTTFSQQINTPAPSPGATLKQTVGLIDITIEYSRPSVKGRTVFGGLEQYGEFWRTGANSANKFTFSGDVKVNGVDLAAGSYTMLTKPGKSSFEVFIYPYESGNSNSYQSKTPAANFKVDVVELPMIVETMTFDVGSLRNNSASINFMWEKTMFSIPVTVDTKSAVMSQIERFAKSPESALANDYNGAAGYLLQEKENLEMALEFATKATTIRPDAFWMLRTKYLIEGELKKFKDAKATAMLSKAAAEKAGNQQYVKFADDAMASWK